MSPWTWLLIGLSAAGLLLVLISIVLVVAQVFALRKKMNALSRRPVLLSLQSLKIQASRFGPMASDAKGLTTRATAAVGSIQADSQTLSMPAAREALDETGAELAQLRDDLR